MAGTETLKVYRAYELWGCTAPSLDQLLGRSPCRHLSLSQSLSRPVALWLSLWRSIARSRSRSRSRSLSLSVSLSLSL